MAFLLELGVISGAVVAVADCFVNVIGHVLPVELTSYGVSYMRRSPGCPASFLE